MQTKAAKAIDINTDEDLIFTTNYRTNPHKWAITCGTCGRKCYVNDQEHRVIVLAIEADCEDLFRCDICAADITDWPSEIGAGQSPGHHL